MIKKSVVIIAAAAMAFNAQGQSLEEGIKLYHYERYESAKKELSPLAESNPTANYYLGLAELNLGNTAAAKTIFDKYPDNYANMGGKARVAFAEGNANMGTQLATALAGKARKKDVDPYRYAADALTYSKDGDKQTAVDWYKEVLERAETAQLHINMGDAYQQLQGGGGSAMNNYEKAVEQSSNKSLAYSRVGKLWYDAKNYKDALSSWEKAQTADPSNPIPYRDMANAYYWVGNYEKALENIEKYLEHSDKSDDDMEQYLDILYLAKNHEKAIRIAKELQSKGIDKARFYGIIGYSQMEMGDSVNALKNVRTYFSKQKQEKIYPLDYINYAKVALMNGMTDTADAYFMLADQKDTASDKSGTYRTIAETFKDNKDYAASAKWYNKILMPTIKDATIKSKMVEGAGKETEQTETDTTGGASVSYLELFPLDLYSDKATANDYFWGGVMYYYSQDYQNAERVFEAWEKKFTDQPSPKYWRGRAGAAIDNEGEVGRAVTHYKSWLNVDVENYEPKKNDLMQAYQYLALYYYKKENKATTMKYLDKIAALEPENAFMKQIKGLLNNAQK